MTNEDVIVVGAGISGLLTALALSKEGKRVLILEKSDSIGGVCRSYNVDGYQVDTGPHVITRLQQGPLRELMQKYFDVIPNFVPHGKYYVRIKNRVRPFPWNLQGWFAFDLLPQIDRIYLMKTLFTFSYMYNTGEDLSKKSIKDIVGDGLSEPSIRFLNYVSYFLTGGPINETPVERILDNQNYKNRSTNIFETLSNFLMKEGATDQSYVKGGLQSLVTAIVSSMPQKSVEIKTCEEVVRISPGEKKIETVKGEYGYNTLIYAGFVSEMPRITDELPKAYADSLSKLPQASSLTIWLGLKEPVFKMPGSEFWIDPDPYVWALPISNYDSHLAPKGKQLVGFAFTPRDENYERGKKNAMNAILSTMPEIENKIEMVHYQSLIPEKAVWTVNTKVADVKSPMEDVYFVGTDTEKRSAGVAKAAYSVLNLLDVLKRDKVI